VDAEFAERFEELYRIAYRASFSVLGTRPDAEDCAQEALARALVRWDRIAEYAPAWTARVAVNVALDITRQRGRATRLRAEPDRAREDEIADRRHDLAVALAALPRRQREAIVLRYLVDLPEAAAAGAMGCTVGTVKSTVARGLQRMQTQLGSRWAWDER
jgi:RNA polymerase sigma-70 factor (ECF subfamily)